MNLQLCNAGHDKFKQVCYKPFFPQSYVKKYIIFCDIDEFPLYKGASSSIGVVVLHIHFRKLTLEKIVS